MSHNTAFELCDFFIERTMEIVLQESQMVLEQHKGEHTITDF